MSDPWEGGGRAITVTIKYGKGYDDSWVVFRGDAESIREDVIGYFGMDRASVAELTLSELIVNATQYAHGKTAVASTLNGAVIGHKPSEAQDAQGKSSDPWAAAEQQASAQPQENPMLARIAACTTGDELRRLWAGDQAAFADAEVMAAWKARGKALQGAAS